MKYYFFPIFAILLFASCKKEKEVIFDPKPVIALSSVTPTDIIEFQDSVIVIINYVDTDGDIGDLSPDEYSVSVKDSRLENSDWYHIQPLAPEGSDLVYSGQIRIKINNMFIIGNATQETATLTVKLKDRAGNWSNETISPLITINKLQ